VLWGRAMSINTGAQWPTKQREREELEKLVATYEQQGGEIGRTRGGKACVKCGICGLASMVAVTRVANYKLRCYRCGSENVTVRW
jgi:hypothetical protein